MRTITRHQCLSAVIAPEARVEIERIVDDRIRGFHVTREDFTGLKNIVQELAEAQKELAEAQKRTEERVEELAEAQKELAEAQVRTEERVEELAEAQKELAEAQVRTEKRVEELAEAQKKTETRVGHLEETVRSGFARISDQIAALGSRWGIYTETAFRGAVTALLSRQEGVVVERGEYGGREVDIVVRNGDHVLLEITSRLNSSDLDKLTASGEDYMARHNVRPALMIAAAYVPPSVMHKILNHPWKIDIFSFDTE